MLKFFYRLRRRRGVVLFAVIAMMTVLITMATVAYFTTRTSYQTVMSNYDFSQMYISTTAVSDMLLDSLSETSLKEGTKESTGATLNYFKDFKDELTKLVDAGKEGAELVGVSSNISWADRNDYSAILKKGAEDAVIPGVLDAVRVSAKLIKITDKNPDGSTVATGLKNYYFQLETVGFYRNNTITVQDYIYQTSGKSKSEEPPMFDTFFTATSQQLVGGTRTFTDTRFVSINTDEITDDAFFQNKFTLLQGGDRSNKIKGGIRTTGGLYLHKIETDIMAPTATERHDWIIGGDMVILQANANSIDLKGNNLYIKGDLIIGCDGFNLKAGSVYVEGNIYFGTGTTIDITGGDTAYAAAKTTDKPGLYVKGDIINMTNASDASTVSGTWSEGKDAFVSLAKTLGQNLTTADLTIAKQFELIGKAASKDKQSYNATAGSTTLKVGDGDSIYQTAGKTNQSGSSVAEMVWSNLNTKIAQGKENTTTSSYDYEIKEMKVEKVLETGSDDPSDTNYNKDAFLKTYKYASYSTEQATVDKVLTLDFSKVKDSEGNTGTSAKVNGTLTCTLGTVGGKDATITFKGNNTVGNLDEAVIDLPYVDGGYRLEYKLANNWGTMSMNFNENKGLVINIHTADGYDSSGDKIEENWTTVTNSDGTTTDIIKSMPIVLTPNYNDGSTNPGVPDSSDSSKTYNAFTWRAKFLGDGSDAQYTNVQVVGQNDSTKAATGSVILEMANYATEAFTDSDGNAHAKNTYVQYDPANSTSIATAKYIPVGREKVGTAKQIADSPAVNAMKYTSDLPTKFFKTTVDGKVTNDLADEYDSKVMLVSNMNNPGVAFEAKKFNTLFGLLYAPNAQFYAPSTDASLPIVGGMIVSDYIGNQASFVYAQPDPMLVKSLGILTSKNKTPPSTGSTLETWTREEGTNYIG